MHPDDVYDRLLLRRFFFFQAEDGIRDLVRSRGLGDVYKRQLWSRVILIAGGVAIIGALHPTVDAWVFARLAAISCLLYTSDAADERSSVDLGGRRIINKTNQHCRCTLRRTYRHYSAT